MLVEQNPSLTAVTCVDQGVGGHTAPGHISVVAPAAIRKPGGEPGRDLRDNGPKQVRFSGSAEGSADPASGDSLLARSVTLKSSGGGGDRVKKGEVLTAEHPDDKMSFEGRRRRQADLCDRHKHTMFIRSEWPPRSRWGRHPKVLQIAFRRRRRRPHGSM